MPEGMSEDEEALCEAFLTLKAKSEVWAFLDDLCTPHEIEEIVVRWKIARLLHQNTGKKKQTGIGEVASATTIGKVRRCLRYGKAGGYRLVLGRLYPPADKP
jgi:TrpR-related protein YerC/YecD